MSEPLKETEREELIRLRDWVKTRQNDRVVANAQALAGFIWTNHIQGPFMGDNALLWDALPDETQELLIEFVRAPKQGPRP